MVAVSPGSMIVDSPPSRARLSEGYRCRRSRPCVSLTAVAGCEEKQKRSLSLRATDRRFSQKVPAFASSDWRKCELSSATQRRGRAGSKYELWAGTFWLTIWSWSWKLVYHALCTACGSAETFMFNKRSYSKVVVLQSSEGYRNDWQIYCATQSEVYFRKDFFYITYNIFTFISDFEICGIL